jgi:alkylhydroperoxidase family enzyme
MKASHLRRRHAACFDLRHAQVRCAGCGRNRLLRLCLAACTCIGKNPAQFDDAEIAANRDRESSDCKANAAVRFAAQVTQARGHFNDAGLQPVRDAGYSDAHIVEIAQHLALNT